MALPWFERNLKFGYTSEMLPFFLERLEGTIARLEKKVSGIDDKILSDKVNEKWSIKQNIGHLAEVDRIANKRIDEMTSAVAIMTPAVFEPKDYNPLAIEDVLAIFRKNRLANITKYQGLSEEQLKKSSLHPRLKVQMTPVDLAWFDAEHDDHHLVKINEILRSSATQTKWFDRKFDFSFSQNIFPSILERLRITPTSLVKKMQNVPEDVLILKTNGNWSIKENIGHLIDLEPLWLGRLDDILNNEKFLRVADLTNSKTDRANHNSKSVNNLLDEFTKLRKETVHRLEQLKESEIYQSALHPRLNTPMRTMDHFLFVAEHDDHHMRTIEHILSTHSK
jgi:uncharacterized damage-inducible protein DinB